MGKEKRKKESFFLCVMRGCIFALLLYLLVCVLSAMLLVKGILPEGSIYSVLTVGSALSTLIGCMVVLRKSTFGKLPTALLVSGAFCCFQLGIGICFWQGITWTGEGGALLICAVGGGFLSALLSTKKRKKGKRLRK